MQPANIREATLQQHHQMDISVSAGGAIKVEVHYKDRVPNLLERFPAAVQRRARSLFWWPTRYERQLLKATKDLPPWAKKTVWQHILHERAQVVEARMQRVAERKKQKELQRQVAMTAVHKRVAIEPPPEQAPVPERASETVDRPAPVAARTKEEPAQMPHQHEPIVLAAETTKPASPVPQIGALRQASGSAWGHPIPGKLSLTEQLAQQHGVAPAIAPKLFHRDRSR